MGFFGGLLKFQIFFGVLEIPDIWGVIKVEAPAIIVIYVTFF